jgi:hypothetical protein
LESTINRPVQRKFIARGKIPYGEEKANTISPLPTEILTAGLVWRERLTAVVIKKVEIFPALDMITQLARRRTYGNSRKGNEMGAQGTGLRVLQL